MQSGPAFDKRSLLFAVTVFTSAFLLFQVQPLLAKFILPWFGGTPAVWTMCMLVFQLLLFGGYAYAHLLSRLTSVSRQASLHAGLLLIGVLLLPIVPDPAWKPVTDGAPSLRIMLLLLATVGAPYFLLSSTGPLLQHWFSRAGTGTSPYRLYALSNVGSLLALVSYPLLFEPMFSSTIQAWLWSVCFFIFTLCCLLCAWVTARQSSLSLAKEPVHELAAEPDRPSPIRWFILAMLPSLMLLATTNEVCMDIAVVPFLWVIPLTLYLLSFILTFESDRFYNRRLMIIVTAASLAGTFIMITRGAFFGVILNIIMYFGNLFAVCMLCHGELVRLKPPTHRLTAFYLTISAGGAAGGLFVGLIAPIIFRVYSELMLGVFVGCLLCIGTLIRDIPQLQKAVPGSTLLKIGAAISGLLLMYLVVFSRHSPSILAIQRNFYGVLRVEDKMDEMSGRPSRIMVHGRVVHGLQFLDAAGRRQPSTYYSHSSGIGRLLRQPAEAGRHIGVIGLGAGTLAVYGGPLDRLRFYEINPTVISFAREHFTFLSDCKSQVNIVSGDARLVLEREPEQQFDVLVLDAFSSDAIPVHLLTFEAMQIYEHHLKPGGVVAVHISNAHFDLEPVVRAMGRESGFDSQVQTCKREADDGVAFDSVWMLMCRDPAVLEAATGRETESAGSRALLWTDDRNNLLNVLK